MVLVSKAIVYKGAVMVKSLYTLVTIITVHSVFWPQILTINADIVQMEFFVNKTFHEAQEVFLERYIPRINQCQAIEDYR